MLLPMYSLAFSFDTIIYKLKNEDGTKVTVISTMSFYINVYKTAIDHDDVSSTSDTTIGLTNISINIESL